MARDYESVAQQILQVAAELELALERRGPDVGVRQAITSLVDLLREGWRRQTWTNTPGIGRVLDSDQLASIAAGVEELTTSVVHAGWDEALDRAETVTRDMARMFSAWDPVEKAAAEIEEVAAYLRAIRRVVAYIEQARAPREVLNLLQETEAARDAAQRAAGVTAEASLEGAYTDLARKHGWAQWGWNLVLAVTVIATLVAIFLLATEFGVLGDDPRSPTISEALFKLGLVTPGIILAVFAARNSLRHAHQRDDARLFATRFKVLDAFLAPMDEQDARLLRLEVGRAALVRSPNQQSSGDLEGDLAEIERVLALLQSAQSVTRGAT